MTNTITRVEDDGTVVMALYLTAEAEAHAAQGNNPFRSHQPQTQEYDWRDDALCAQTDPELFFPADGMTTTVAAAKKVCDQCDVRKQCLAWALKNRENYGVWGGLTKAERAALGRKPNYA